jgi:chromatin structure-remodeling complex protein RSC7
MFELSLISDGRWVTDDYYEDECLAKCTENGFIPNAVIHEEEIVANAMNSMERPQQTRNNLDPVATSHKQYSFGPFYTLGGPSTHFAGNGLDPWSDAGWGNKRTKLRAMGVTEEDWMYRVAAECRRVDETLKEYRAERIGVLGGQDLKGWVWSAEESAAGSDTLAKDTTAAPTLSIDPAPKSEASDQASADVQDRLRAPSMPRRRSGLSKEVTFGQDHDLEVSSPSAQTDDPHEADGAMDVDEAEGSEGDDKLAVQTTGEAIVVETAEEQLQRIAKLGSWKAGVVRAVYEVSPFGSWRDCMPNVD